MEDAKERLGQAIDAQFAGMNPKDRERALQMAKHRMEGRTEEDVRDRMERQARKMNNRARLARANR